MYMREKRLRAGTVDARLDRNLIQLVVVLQREENVTSLSTTASISTYIGARVCRQTSDDRDVLQPSEDLPDRTLFQDCFLPLINDIFLRELGPDVHFIVSSGVVDPIPFDFAGVRSGFHEDLDSEVTKPELVV